jgi:hypothetical protein
MYRTTFESKTLYGIFAEIIFAAPNVLFWEIGKFCTWGAADTQHNGFPNYTTG